MNHFLSTLWADESGQDLAEYVLLLVLIAVVVAAAILLFREAIVNGFNRATGQLNSSVGSA